MSIRPRSLVALGLVPLLAMSTMVAQEPPASADPAAALVQPFAQLVGRFRAEGQLHSGDGAAVTAWQATADARWVLGGHFVQEDIEVGSEGAAPLQTRTVFGWDGARDRFVAASIANDGRSRLSEVVWTEARQLVAVTREEYGGRPVLLRSVWKFDDTGYDYRLDRTVGDGPWQGVVTGRFDRVDELPARAAEASRGGAAIGSEMARVAAWVGSYALEGERVDADGRTLTPASGTDTVRAMYGGQALVARVVLGTDGGEFEVLRYLAWDPTAQRYQVFSFDDMGSVGITRLRWEGEDALVGETAESDGTETFLVATRIELGSNGLRRVLTRTVLGTGEVVDQITLRYRRSKEER